MVIFNIAYVNRLGSLNKTTILTTALKANDGYSRKLNIDLAIIILDYVSKSL